jgi:hypothetical protein
MTENDTQWIFECVECGERWIAPDAPVTGHHCDWDGRGMPPVERDPADVVAISSPDRREK